MTATIFTKDYNAYQLSNDPNDNGLPYVTKEDALYIFLTNPNNLYFNYQTEHFSRPYIADDKPIIVYSVDSRYLLFNYQHTAIIIPYNMITNILYTDKAGEDLAAFILSKKNGEVVDIPPLIPPIQPDPETPPLYTAVTRDNRVLGEQIYKEIPIITFNFFSNIVRDERLFGEQIYAETPLGL
jgi:hypothetical protein